MRRAAALVVALLAVGIVTLAQGPRRDGKWEVTMQMEMAGMPAGMPPFTSTQCITPEEAKDPDKTLPQMGRGRGRGNQNCKTTDQKIEGNKVTATIKCEGEPAMNGTCGWLPTRCTAAWIGGGHETVSRLFHMDGSRRPAFCEIAGRDTTRR